jgi:2'-5' RNA ligase
MRGDAAVRRYRARVPYLSPVANAPGPTQTALIAPVPAVEAVVGAHRDRFDVAAGWGVPAHVTVLYPFVSPDQVTDELVAGVARALASVRAFECRFDRTGWFGEDVVWLDPYPAQPFRDLTNAVWRMFPRHPPYAGAHPDVIPHLTIAERRLAEPAVMHDAEQSVRQHLPLTARIERVLLIAGAPAPASWRLVHQFPLAAAD